MKSSTSNLAPRELYRYDWRLQRFLQKYRNGDPLTLVSGDDVILKYDPSIDTMLSYRTRSKITLTSLDGKKYSLSNFAKTAEFGGGGGLGGGTALTKLTESAQAVYACAKWYGEDLSTAYAHSYVDVDSTTILNKLPLDWMKSCVVGANVLYQQFGSKNYQFHRGSSWVNSLESLFKKLNAEERIFSNLNKWSPADIYMVSDIGRTIDFSHVKSIIELNKVLASALESRDILGISLKYLSKSASVSFHNVGQSDKQYTLDRISVGLTGFFSSKDALIYFGEADKIQFRTFPETFQGEIKGKNANHGKVSYGPIQTILKSLCLPPLDNTKEVRERIAADDRTLFEEFYFMYRSHCEDAQILDLCGFIEACKAKGAAWIFSKFLCLQLVNSIVKFDRGDEFVTACIRYASSSSELSAPFVKLE